MKAAARNRAEVDALVDKLDGEGNGFITMDDIIAVHPLPRAHYARTADMRMQRATCSECSAAHNRDHRRPISPSPYSMHARHTTYNRHETSTSPTHSLQNARALHAPRARAVGRAGGLRQGAPEVFHPQPGVPQVQAAAEALRLAPEALRQDRLEAELQGADAATAAATPRRRAVYS